MTHWLVPGPLHLLLALGALLAWSWRPAPTLRSALSGGRLAGPRRAPASTRMLLAAAFALAWIAATPGFAELALRRLEGSPAEAAAALADARPDPSALVVVLASGEMTGPDGEPDVRLDIHGVERVRAAVSLWRRTGGRLLVTGGPGFGDRDSLAGAMAALARDLGVPDDAIVRSPGSHTTHQDLLFAAERIRATDGPRWLVTSALHMPRAMAVARAQRLGLRPLPCDYRQIRDMGWRSWWPDAQAARRLQPVLHELLGGVAYRWRGWAA